MMCVGVVWVWSVTGEFDSIDSTNTKLRNLLDQRLIGNREFHLLSGHALLGFRLLPGPVSPPSLPPPLPFRHALCTQLPEQYRMDPPSQETHSHHRKKKHKHKSIEKIGEEGTDLNPPSVKVKMPGDAFSFVKPESASLLHSTPSPNYVYSSTAVERSMPVSVQKVVGSSASHLYPQSMAPCKQKGRVASRFMAVLF